FMAANFLEFGTRVKIPEHFGEQVFVVEDRMARRKTEFVDIWMPTKQDALDFGIHRAKIIILN
ncbi:MAG: 3D domain-containing protein, partial [Candidatus Niyogibacteria bacterium]|nr:3D domain-containing protein [Candidatus Niyogibacteria bacterium]